MARFLILIALSTCGVAAGMSCAATAGPDVLGAVSSSLDSNVKLRAPVEKVLEEMVKVKFAKDAVETDGATLEADMVPVHFNLPILEAKPWNQVTVVGSWTQEPWGEHFKLLKKDDGFAGWVDMPIGMHRFKFIADGKWLTSDEYPLETDEAGNQNNVMNITVDSTAAVQSETPSVADSANEMLRAVTAPFRFAFRVIFTPLRLFLRLFGPM